MSKQFYFNQISLALVCSLNVKNVQFSAILPIDMTLSGANTSAQNGLRSDVTEGVLCIPQNSRITGTSTSDCLVSLSGHSLGGLTLLQSSRCILLPADWAIQNLILKVICPDHENEKRSDEFTFWMNSSLVNWVSWQCLPTGCQDNNARPHVARITMSVTYRQDDTAETLCLGIWDSATKIIFSWSLIHRQPNFPRAWTIFTHPQKKFRTKGDVETALEYFLISKYLKFYRTVINNLVNR